MTEEKNESNKKIKKNELDNSLKTILPTYIMFDLDPLDPNSLKDPIWRVFQATIDVQEDDVVTLSVYREVYVKPNYKETTEKEKEKIKLIAMSEKHMFVIPSIEKRVCVFLYNLRRDMEITDKRAYMKSEFERKWMDNLDYGDLTPEDNDNMQRDYIEFAYEFHRNEMYLYFAKV